MKKLMVAATVAFMATFANASVAKWSIEYASNPFLPQVGGYAADAGSETMAYIFADSASLGVTGTTKTYGYDLAKAALEGGAFDFADKAFDSLSFANGTAYNSTGAGSFADGTASANNEVKIYAVLVTKDAEGKDRWYITDDLATSSINNLGGVTTAALGDLDYATKSTSVAGNWYAAPEPTSGLLLLIGMAGLALRRRRA